MNKGMNGIKPTYITTCSVDEQMIFDSKLSARAIHFDWYNDDDEVSFY
jgi:hypothetical protein